MSTYILYDVVQGSQEWLDMRKGLITMSNIGKIVGHSPYFKGSKEELAMLLKGEKEEKFTPEAIERMKKGNEYEDPVRRVLSRKLGKEIKETGFAVWKKDKRFGASLDGIIDDECGIEIKCPSKMYKPIIEYMNNEERDENDISHIWKSQYDQVIGNGVITGRKYMYFCVYGIEDRIFFYQKIKVDYDYFNNFLYPKAVEFYDNYMVDNSENKEEREEKEKKE